MSGSRRAALAPGRRSAVTVSELGTSGGCALSGYLMGLVSESITQVSMWRLGDRSREGREGAVNDNLGERRPGRWGEVEPVVFAGELHVECKGKKGVREAHFFWLECLEA